MTIPEISNLTREVAASNARDAQEQAGLLQRIKSLRDTLEQAAATDLLGYLDTAAVLTEYLAHMNGIGPEEIQQIVTKLLAMVEEAFDMEANPPAQKPQVSLNEAPSLTAAGTQQGSGGPPARVQLKLTEEAKEKLSVRTPADHFLGEVLIQLRAVTEEQVHEALQVQRATGLRIGEALVKIGAADWRQIENAIQVQEKLRHTAGPLPGGAPSTIKFD